MVKFLFGFQARHALQEGSISATDLCNTCLKRVKLIEPLNAFVSITEEKALKQAEKSNKRLKEGKVYDCLYIYFV